MKNKILLLFIFLMLFIPANAMSGSTDLQQEVEEYKITQEELHNLAVNNYKFMFEEEHEWKGMKREKGEEIIKDITPIKDGELTVAYLVNYSLGGTVLITAHKNSVIYDWNGGDGYYNPLDDKNSIISKDIKFIDMNVKKNFHALEREGLRKKRDRAINKVKPSAKEQEYWNKFLVHPDKFNERFDFKNQFPPPKWWIEKKKPKNSKYINGLIDSEWNQDPPFNDQCPLDGGVRSLVGCTALAMSQVMRYYEWPNTGVGDFSSYTYNWQNMPSYLTISNSDVAQICYHTGLSINAVYSDSTTTAFISDTPIALSKSFNYTSQLRSRAVWYSYSDWIDKLKDDIYSYKPVLYGGYFPFDTTTVDSTSMHTWIIDAHRNSSGDQFNCNVGQINTNLNKWYIASEIISLDEWKDNNAIFNIKPDHPDSALTLPYKQDFENVITGSGIYQIPINMGVSHKAAFSVINNVDNKALYTDMDTDLENEWFLIKKINLTCDSVPVFRFQFKTILNNMSGNDSISVEISNDNRISWDTLLVVDNNTYESTTDLNDEIKSLNAYRNDVVNIRIKCNHTRNDLIYYFDNIEFGKLGFEFKLPQEYQSFNKNDYFDFEVIGKSDNDEVLMANIENIGSVTYDLKDETLTSVLAEPIITNSDDEYKSTIDLSDYTLTSGKYFVSAVIKDTENNLISEIIDMPIWIDNLHLDIIRKTPGSKADWYAIESNHEFDAICIDYDQPWMTTINLDKVEYYYKDEFGVYQLLGTSTTPSSPDPIIYTSPQWSSGSDDMAYIKGMAYYTPDGETVQNYIVREITVSIADRYCVIDTPDSTNNVIGFNELITIAGRVISQDDMSTIRPERDIVDVGLGLSVFSQDYIDNHQPSASIFDWSQFDYASIGGKEVEIKNNGKLEILTQEQNKNDENDITTEIKPNEKESEFSVVWYNNYYRLLPGLHTATVWGEENYDYAHSISATEAEMNFLVPSWDLKFYNRDLWPDNPGLGFDAALDEQKEYRAGTDGSFIIWRPEYSATPAVGDLTTFFSIKSQYTGSEVDNLSAITQPEVSKKVDWNTGTLDPGYYTVEATEIDSESGIEVVKEREIQILPYHVDWENAGSWPLNWTGSDNDFWKIYKISQDPHPLFGEYVLESIYGTFTKNKSNDLTSQSVSIDRDWEVFIDIPIGIWKSTGPQNFDPMLADCIIQVDCGAGFETEYKIDPQDYIDAKPNWGEEASFCTMNRPISLGVLNGNNVQIRISIADLSKSDNFTKLEPDTQRVIFDNIRVRYSKEVSLLEPTNYSVSTIGTNTYLTWSPPSKEIKQNYEYNIYKDGRKIGTTTETSYLDLTNEEYTSYTYSVTAYDPLTEEESVQRLARSGITTGEDLYPTPANFTLTQGSGSEYNCVELNWAEPDSNVIGYDIYRNGELYYQTTNTSYEDMWLDLGNYDYYVTAVYGEGLGEVSGPTLTLNVVIAAPKILPLEENFEDGDLLSSDLSNYIHEEWTGNCYSVDSTGVVEIPAYEGDYYAYANGKNTGFAWCRSGLRSPDYDLSMYNNITLSYNCNLYQTKYNRDMNISSIVSLCNNSEIWSANVNDTVYYYPRAYSLHSCSNDRNNNGVWLQDSVAVNYDFSDCYFLFGPSIYYANGDNPELENNSYIFLDDILITGNIALVPPSNLTIIRYTLYTTLDWDAVPDATQYTIYRSERPDINYQSIGSTANITFDDNETNLEHNAYFYRVVAESTQKILPKNRNQRIAK